MNRTPLVMTWGEFQSEEIRDAIDSFLEQHESLTHWESRATAEWLLGNYGRAPASVDVPDEAVALHLIQCALSHHLDISPNMYSLTIDKIGAVQSVSATPFPNAEQKGELQ